VRKVTSLKIDPGIWKEVKLHCVREEINISDYIEKLFIEKLKIKKGDNK